MIIVKPSAILLSFTHSAEQLIELAGRTCYKSEDRISPTSSKKFIEMLVLRGHESVIEHAVATIKIITDRGVTHELVRHRLVSYSQESTRYCKYKEGIAVIQPPGLTEEQKQSWEKAMQVAEATYLHLLQSGAPPQIARSVLPTCLKTEIVVTTNFREWRHILRLRLSKEAHPQIREVMEIIKGILTEIAPTIFMEV